MTNSDEAIREIAEAEYPDIPGISERAPYNQIMATNRTNLIARLTALISEHYVAKEGVEKMASERLRDAPKNCPKAAQCSHVEGGMKCPPNVICPI